MPAGPSRQIRQSSRSAGKIDAWSAHCARLIDDLHSSTFPVVLERALRHIVSFQDIVVLAFHGEERPVALYDNIEDREHEIQIDRYLTGPYLLDPFYLAFSNERLTGVYRLSDLAPDQFKKTEYYQRYYKRAGMVDEAGYLIRIGPDTFVHISLDKRRPGQSFSRREINALERTSPVVEATIRRHWTPLLASEMDERTTQRELHRRILEAFENFGKSVLTDREAEIVKLMMRGHSAKSAARVMSISPGTVMNHRRNIYAKLKINSQLELFNLFFQSITAGGGERGRDPLSVFGAQPVAGAPVARVDAVK